MGQLPGGADCSKGPLSGNLAHFAPKILTHKPGLFGALEYYSHHQVCQRAARVMSLLLRNKGFILIEFKPGANFLE